MNISFSREPAVWVAVIKAIILAGVTFGLKVTMEQLAAVVIALEAIGTLIVRQNVYAPVDKAGDPITVAK